MTLTFDLPVSVAQWVKPLLNRPQCLLARRAEYFRGPGFKARLGQSFRPTELAGMGGGTVYAVYA